MSATLSVCFASSAARRVWNDNAVVKPEGDAGVDLFCVEDAVVPARGRARLDFGVRCEMRLGGAPTGFFLVPRSSISRTPLRMSNSVGVIDAGYRGNLMACVDNLSDEPFEVRAGQRLFQVVHPLLVPVEVREVEELAPTQRGSGGFGSTGV